MRRNGTPEDLLSRPGPLAILLCLLHRGPQTYQDLETTVGVQSGTIRYHIKALRAAGFVTIEPSKPAKIQIVDEKAVARALGKLRPDWRSGGIPRGALWLEIQAAIDTRRIRAKYLTRLPFSGPRKSALGSSPRRHDRT